MHDYDELVKSLRENAEWAEGNIWEVPIMLPDNLKQAADAIEELVSNADKFKWISVEERLPEDKETCLIWYEYYHYSFERVLPEYGIGFYLSMHDMWYGDPSTGKDVKVLYWTPLPEPPAKEDGKNEQGRFN